MNGKGMAEWFGVMRSFMLRLGGFCMYCTMEGMGGLGAEYVWPDRRRYVVVLFKKASF